MGFDYDVFFSYRHRPLDGEITQKSFNALESYKLPRRIRRQGFENIRRAFRDTEELPVSRILTETIDSALHSCNCLVVVCSTDTPASEWIDREVSIFIEIGRAEHIYPLLISGDPEHSFPPSLKLVPDIADRIMDIRTEGNDVKKMMAKAETELLKVIAGITGCEHADLLREHQLRRSRRIASRAGGAAAVLLAVTGISLGLMNMARSYRDEAALREQASMRILNELTYSLPDHLTNVPGAYARIADILRSNTEDINRILRLSNNKEAAEFEAAQNYGKLAESGRVLGQYGDALDSQNQAIEIYSALADSGYPGSKPALASAYNNRGRILNSAGRYEEAGKDYLSAADLLEDSEETDYLLLARIAINSGINYSDLGNINASIEEYEKALDLLEKLESTEEMSEGLKKEDLIEAFAKANYNYGLLLLYIGKYNDAEQHLNAAVELFKQFTGLTDSLQNRNNHFQTVTALALCQANQGRYGEAGENYDKAIRIVLYGDENKDDLPDNVSLEDYFGNGSLATFQADNTDALLNLANLYNNRGLCYNILGDYPYADKYYQAAAEIYRIVSERTGAASDAALYAQALINIGENAFKMGNYNLSDIKFAEGIEKYEEAHRIVCKSPDLCGSMDHPWDAIESCESLDSSFKALYFAWLSYYELTLKDYDFAYKIAVKAYRLQPDSMLVKMNYGYACLYSGHYDEAEKHLLAIAGSGEGQAENVIKDLDAQERAGLSSPYFDSIYADILPYVPADNQ